MHGRRGRDERGREGEREGEEEGSGERKREREREGDIYARASMCILFLYVCHEIMSSWDTVSHDTCKGTHNTRKGHT